MRLTSAGTELPARAKAAIIEHEAWLKGRFSDRELATLEEILALIYR